MLAVLIIANLALVNGEYVIDAYDCNESSYIYNVTTKLHSLETKDDLFFMDQEVQIIQNVADTDTVCRIQL